MAKATEVEMQGLTKSKNGMPKQKKQSEWEKFKEGFWNTSMTHGFYSTDMWLFMSSKAATLTLMALLAFGSMALYNEYTTDVDDLNLHYVWTPIYVLLLSWMMVCFAGLYRGCCGGGSNAYDAIAMLSSVGPIGAGLPMWVHAEEYPSMSTDWIYRHMGKIMVYGGLAILGFFHWRRTQHAQQMKEDAEEAADPTPTGTMSI